jgi:hypothetical protein
VNVAQLLRQGVAMLGFRWLSVLYILVYSITGIAVTPGLACSGEVQGVRTPSRAGRTRKLPAFPVKFSGPFAGLADWKYSKRIKAYKLLVARGRELSVPAAAEAKRLAALPRHKNKSVQEVIDFAVLLLKEVVAENKLMQSWKKGVPPKAAAVSGQRKNAACVNVKIGKLLQDVSAKWGVSIKLSPVAMRLVGHLEVTLEGEPTLKQFLDWLGAQENLSCGVSGGQVVFVPQCSLKMKAPCPVRILF